MPTTSRGATARVTTLDGGPGVDSAGIDRKLDRIVSIEKLEKVEKKQ